MERPVRAKAPAAAAEGVRLQALIARAGLASRREAEEMIRQGRVSVNGEVVTELGRRAVPGRDHVKVDGHLLREEERKVYFLFNKPKGVITAVSDPHGRPVVTDYLKVRERVFPVGRLDWDTEGVLLLTNDGDLAYTLTHPKFEVPRVYQAKVRGIPEERTIERLRRGVLLDDGRANCSEVRVLEDTGKHAWLEVVVHEGRNRLVRRILEAVGHPVSKLKRVSFAGLELGKLHTGQARVLTEREVSRLKSLSAHAAPAGGGGATESAPAPGFAPPPPDFRPGRGRAGARAEAAEEEE